jgi:hypothetical protein
LRRPKPVIKPYLLFDLKINHSFASKLAEEISRVVDRTWSIAVISQASLIESIKQETASSDRFSFCTLDSIYGMEVEILVFEATEELFSLEDQVLNILLTRAKRGVYICGNFNAFKVSAIISST